MAGCGLPFAFARVNCDGKMPLHLRLLREKKLSIAFGSRLSFARNDTAGCRRDAGATRTLRLGSVAYLLAGILAVP